MRPFLLKGCTLGTLNTDSQRVVPGLFLTPKQTFDFGFSVEEMHLRYAQLR
jgi:hypothetical protein